MSDESKQNIEELLSGYVDGELSKRKYNELQRLMEHDPELAEKYAMLKKQKQLLNAMPIENAPEGLFDAVIASQERKFILNEYSEASVESEGIKHLMFRRAMTAAVILILFGGLAGIIISIMKPANLRDPEIVKNDEGTSVDFVPDGISPTANLSPIDHDTPVFRASLDLKTEKSIEMNSFIMKAIFTHGLNDFVNPREIEGTSSTIRITCGIDSVVGLLTDLQTEWDKCNQASLSVYDHALAKEIVVENISSKQLMRVFAEDKFYTRMQMAKDYADINRLNPYGKRLANGNPDTDDAVKPEFTSANSDRKDRLEDGEKISLVITITGI